MDEGTQKNAEKKAAVIIIVIVLLAGLLFYINSKTNIKDADVDFTRRVFAGFIKGRQSVQDMVDWERLKGMGVDVGQTYSGLPNGTERADYRRAFISTSALAYRQRRVGLSSFINWRLYGKKGDSVIVACDCKGTDKTILFTFSKTEDGKRRLVGMKWE